MYRLILLLAALCIATPAFAQDGASGDAAPVGTTEDPAPAADDDDSSAADPGAPASEAAASDNEGAQAGDTTPGTGGAELNCEPAASGPAEGFAKWDGIFGKYVVGPIASVLFWDVWFWDNPSSPESDESEKWTAEQWQHWRLTNWSQYDIKVNVAAIKGLGECPEKAEEGEDVSCAALREEVFACNAALAAEVEALSGRDPAAALAFAEKGGLPLLTDYTTLTEAEGLKGKLKAKGFEASLEANTVNFPIVVLWLVFGACFFTLRMNFINLRGFRHAIKVTAGTYDNPEEEGEITHFEALAAALSATVGLGNIAGVAIAVAVGGPGAVFWMVLAGFLGMSSKFVECTLGQMYRVKDDKGQMSGGPMQYLRSGLSDLGMGRLGKVLAFFFAVMCIGGSFGGGNMFQANQSAQLVGDLVPLLGEYPGIYGLLLAVAVGLVIVGGIKRIGMAASAIVPAMCGIYVVAGLVVLAVNAAAVPEAFGVIISSAFTTASVGGGAIGVLIQGFRRAAFSNEAGVGSAAIAHSAASTDEPVREGIVALLEPFIDTIIICTMTGLVIVTSGVYTDETLSGIAVTAAAFATVIPWFPVILSIAAVLFAFSTMISWSYYGERCWTSLFGTGSSLIYKLLFLVCVFLGSVFSLGSVLDFSDLMILGMAFPNILGCLLLSGKVRGALDTYLSKLESGEFKPTK